MSRICRQITSLNVSLGEKKKVASSSAEDVGQIQCSFFRWPLAGGVGGSSPVFDRPFTVMDTRSSFSFFSFDVEPILGSQRVVAACTQTYLHYTCHEAQ